MARGKDEAHNPRRRPPTPNNIPEGMDADSYMAGWRHAMDNLPGRNERFSSMADYSHWGEEAPIVKAQEDKWAEYYHEPRDPNAEDYEI